MNPTEGAALKRVLLAAHAYVVVVNNPPAAPAHKAMDAERRAFDELEEAVHQALKIDALKKAVHQTLETAIAIAELPPVYRSHIAPSCPRQARSSAATSRLRAIASAV
jgi:hypothetical protein